MLNCSSVLLSLFSTLSCRNTFSGLLYRAMACFLGARRRKKILANVVPRSISRSLLPVDCYCQYTSKYCYCQYTLCQCPALTVPPSHPAYATRTLLLWKSLAEQTPWDLESRHRAGIERNAASSSCGRTATLRTCCCFVLFLQTAMKKTFFFFHVPHAATQG